MPAERTRTAVFADAQVPPGLTSAPAAIWALGLAIGALVVGPGLAPGSLINLDLIVVPESPVPPGVWGLGPELPRRVPLWMFTAWLDRLVGGDLLGKALIVGGLTLAFVGMFRFARALLDTAPAAMVLAAGAAGVYAFGPFLVTRAAVGHLLVLWTMALLPWAVPDLLAAHRAGPRVFLWSLAFGVAGVYGAAICASVLVAGQLVARGKRAGPVAGAFVAGQLVWLVPMVVVVLTAPAVALSDASGFRASVSGIGALGGLAAGLGFWSPAFQVGADQPYLAVLGVVLAGLAGLGTGDLPRPWRAPLTVLAGVSFVVSASSVLLGLESLALWFTSTAVGAPFRETQRMLALFLFWLAPASALGAARLARMARSPVAAVCTVVPLTAALALAGPGLWGAGGQLQPVTFGPDWEAARAVVEDQPGTMVALPWFQYYSSEMTRHRTALDVTPYFFNGDVITASDPRITVEPRQERLDPREAPVRVLVDRLRRGEHVSGALADLGVRWVALQHAIDWRAYIGLDTDPGLETVVEGDELTLLRVRGWRGPVWGADGEPVGERGLVAPLRTLDDPGAATRAAPYQTGWLQGWAPVTEAPNGLMALPGGSTRLWFWPTLLVIATDVALATAAVATVISSRFRRSLPIEGDDA